MNETLDELAGIVDLFGGLTREELSQAMVELGARRGDEPDEEAVETTIAEAVRWYYLILYERPDADDLLVAGPAAFPTLPEHAEDLPHIMDVDARDFDRERLGEQVADRIATDADAAIEAGDEEALERLLDVTYDVEAWAPVELDGVRDRLDDALDGDEDAA